jgi:hypothetical protein
MDQLQGCTASSTITCSLQTIGTDDGVNPAMLQIQTRVDHQPSMLESAAVLSLFCPKSLGVNVYVRANITASELMQAAQHQKVDSKQLANQPG